MAGIGLVKRGGLETRAALFVRFVRVDQILAGLAVG
jgi:hypothetical protein